MESFFPFFFPVLWVSVAALISLVLGIYGLYRDFPPDDTDPIEDTFYWSQVGFGPLFFGGHAPMNLKLGRRCLHLKEPFPFQPLFWLGPASIPWDRIRIKDRISDRSWAVFSWITLEIQDSGKLLRLSGRVGRALQACMDARAEAGVPPPVPNPIRPT
ncbi:MAG TPA: hypothetical protein VJ600_02835 [Holophagaceae bacterium]|nr:hypothetical protein [Holophagaceae bacterium]